LRPEIKKKGVKILAQNQARKNLESESYWKKRAKD
jgi:hypothetical protein